MAEDRLEAFAADPQRRYPAPLPYVIAETEKGFGFPGAGTNAAHNLPLVSNPHWDAVARELFNSSARALHVPLPELQQAVAPPGLERAGWPVGASPGGHCLLQLRQRHMQGPSAAVEALARHSTAVPVSVQRQARCR